MSETKRKMLWSSSGIYTKKIAISERVNGKKHQKGTPDTFRSPVNKNTESVHVTNHTIKCQIQGDHLPTVLLLSLAHVLNDTSRLKESRIRWTTRGMEHSLSHLKKESWYGSELDGSTFCGLRDPHPVSWPHICIPKYFWKLKLIRSDRLNEMAPFGSGFRRRPLYKISSKFVHNRLICVEIVITYLNMNRAVVDNYERDFVRNPFGQKLHPLNWFHGPTSWPRIRIPKHFCILPLMRAYNLFSSVTFRVSDVLNFLN